jgi:uncharacterized protein (TIGR03067 family)
MNTYRVLATSFVCLFLATALPCAADDAKDEAVKKDRMLYEGTWRIVSLTVDGKEANETDAQKITVINGADGSWTIEVDGKEIAKGTSEIDPTKKPKTIDIKTTEGNDAGKTSLGIYEISKDTRKVCIAKPDGERPKAFESKSGSGFILATFKRENK